MSYNSCTFTGRLGKDPELKSTNSGKSVATFSLAVDDGFGDKKSTIWVNFEAWDKSGETIARLVGKGCRLTVNARYKEETWDQNGETKRRSKFVVQNFDIIDFINDNPANNNQDSDDIPF